MKLVNYNPGIISENIQDLRAATQKSNVKKNHAFNAIKIAMFLYQDEKQYGHFLK